MATNKYRKGELEKLWIKAGGSTATANIAAAIALAESGGNPNARNPEGPEHAEGLWQIKGQLVGGNILNPEVNAKNAVAKYNAAKGFSPWTTFTSGAYKSHLFDPAETVAEGDSEGPKGGKELGEGAEKVTGIPFKKAGEAVDSVGGFLTDLTTPSTWLRVAEGVGGVILFFVGLKTLTRGTAGATVVNQPVSAAKGVAKKATEAAAAAVIA
jgi:hypothetical protein